MGKKLYLLLILSGCSALAIAQNATIKGRIVDNLTGKAVAGAVIRFDEYKNAITSNDSGDYILSNIVPGEYKIKIKSLGYAEFEHKINLIANQVLMLDVRLEQKSENLQTVNVYGKLDKASESAATSSEKNANNITNVVTAKIMERSPDINAANVLSRVSGVTIERNTGGDEAYAIIRGLEPRYNNTLINGVKVTSPDEKSRYVSLDVVPSDLLQRIEVYDLSLVTVKLVSRS